MSMYAKVTIHSANPILTIKTLERILARAQRLHMLIPSVTKKTNRKYLFLRVVRLFGLLVPLHRNLNLNLLTVRNKIPISLLENLG